MYKRVWLLRCTNCRLVYGFHRNEISMNSDGEPCREMVEDKGESDCVSIHCTDCGFPLETLQQVGEW